MQHLDGLYTQRFNRLHRRDGAFFKGRYKAIVVATRYGPKVEDLMKGKRGKDTTSPERSACIWPKGLCDLKLKEIAAHSGTASYGTVGWACHGVASRMRADARFRKRVSSIRRSCQQKIWPHHHHWHYINWPLSRKWQPDSVQIKEPEPVNTLTAMAENESVVKSARDAERKAIILERLFRLVSRKQPFY